MTDESGVEEARDKNVLKISADNLWEVTVKDNALLLIYKTHEDAMRAWSKSFKEVNKDE